MKDEELWAHLKESPNLTLVRELGLHCGKCQLTLFAAIALLTESTPAPGGAQ